MNTSYIRLVDCYDDPVWGRQFLPELKSALIRVHRNRLRKAVFEWVGSGRQFNIAEYRRERTVVMYEASERYAPWHYMKTMPLPKDCVL